jgi:hypothetical protein
MGFKNEHCRASAYTSAGAFVVATTAASFYGIMCSGSANNTTITIKDGVTTAANTIAVFGITATTGNVFSLAVPVACTSGITATNAGTVTGYVVMYGK